MDNDIIFDFGFTAATEEELSAPILENAQVAVSTSKAEVEELQLRLNKLHSAIQPLLENLKANPEKDCIHWPNRTAKIDGFKQVLESIYNGEK